MAMMTPVRLKISASGASMMPSVMSRSLIRPFSCNRMNQAAVRTRSEVQSGRSTAASIRSRFQPEREAAMMA